MIRRLLATQSGGAAAREGKFLVEKRSLLQPLEAAEFVRTCDAILGFGWQSKLSRITGVSRSQINRYATEKSPIPKYMSVLVLLMFAVNDQARLAPYSMELFRAPDEA
jgi:hypothetical protein